MKFSELQLLLKENYGIEHLSDIARELDVSPQAVSNWKARDKVPYKYLLRIRDQLEKSKLNYVGEEVSYPQYDINNPSYESKKNLPIEGFNISIVDILITIINNIRILITTPIICSIIMIIHVQYFAQPVYKSTSKIISSIGSGGSSSSPLTQVGNIAAQFGINLNSGQSEARWVYTEVLKSRSLARTMLKRNFDTKIYGSNKSLLQILTYGNGIPEFGKDTLEILGVESLIKMIEINQDLKSGVYTLNIYGPEPQFVADIAEALIEELDSYQREYNNTRISETRQFIYERMLETEKELSESEETLKDFRQANRRLQNSPALLLEQDRLLREVSVLTGVYTILKQQLENVKIEEVKDSEYVIILDPPEAPLFRTKPKKKRLVILSGISGILLGLFFVFIKQSIINNNIMENDGVIKLKQLFIKNILGFFPFLKNRL